MASCNLLIHRHTNSQKSWKWEYAKCQVDHILFISPKGTKANLIVYVDIILTGDNEEELTRIILVIKVEIKI